MRSTWNFATTIRKNEHNAHKDKDDEDEAPMINRNELHLQDFSDVCDGETLPPVSPGEVLADFLADYGITPYRLAKDTGMPPTRPGAIINDGRAITADTALRLGKYFGNTPEFWTNLQAMHDIRELLLEKRAEFEQIRTIAETKAR